MQVQRVDGTAYSQFALHQDATTLSGTWTLAGKKYNVDGTYDGRFFRLNAKLPDGSYTLSGYVENSTDMVGIVDNGKGQIRFINPLAFTAEHRAPHGKPPVYSNKPPAGY